MTTILLVLSTQLVHWTQAASGAAGRAKDGLGPAGCI